MFATRHIYVVQRELTGEHTGDLSTFVKTGCSNEYHLARPSKQAQFGKRSCRAEQKRPCYQFPLDPALSIPLLCYCLIEWFLTAHRLDFGYMTN
jgi:hypothetical protein